MTRRIGGQPVSLFESSRFLSQGECEALAARAISFARGGGETTVTIDSGWRGLLRWGRNRVTLGGDQRPNAITVGRAIQGSSARVTTNQVDDASLEAAVRTAERTLALEPRAMIVWHRPDPLPHFEYPTSHIWSDDTVALEAEARAATARALIAPAEAGGMSSAGYLAVEGRGLAYLTSEGISRYARQTQAQCSMTVRDPTGNGSGWAGLSSYDWARIEAPALAQRALEKCLASRAPVALEPGRYTVILEPQAVCDLLRVIFESNVLSRLLAESDSGPFADQARNGFSKLGLKVADPRVTIGQDPTDPQLGVVPFVLQSGEPLRAVNWIDHGVLAHLAYDRQYALTQLDENLGYPNGGAFRMGGGDASVPEMIRTTQRGLLVTRFSSIDVLDERSLLLTGVTRDGLWLIENGKITKAVKNLRFTESPLFVLNSLEQLGEPVPTFRPWSPAVVPPLKAHDFSFTSTIDAI
jgi:predicted Zn-dependent protease